MADDLVLRRIAYDPGQQEKLPHVNWPSGLAPADIAAPSGAALPSAGVLVVTWTEAEARALADVLSPGVPSTGWVRYDTDFSLYEAQLTSRSPARSEGRLGSWASMSVGGIPVVLFKSELHPATDGTSLPTAQLIRQLAAATRCGAVITTGTAGGAGVGTQLGDVNVARIVRADFTERLSGQPYSRMSWQARQPDDGQGAWLAELGSLIPTPGYPPGDQWGYAGRPTVWHGDVVSTDFFAFDTADDHFGLRAYDPGIRMVEMDDAAVAYGASSMNVPVYSVRNASDPVMPAYSPETVREANDIYERYGYFTTINSAVGVWCLIAPAGTAPRM